MRNIFVATFLLCVFFTLTVTSISKNSGTCDEIAHHIPAGYSYYQKWDFRLNPSNPPLARYIMALPLNFFHLKAPFDDKSWQEADTPSFGKKFFFEYNRGKAHTILFLSRLAMVFVGMLCAIIVYLFASRIYGKKCGLFALLLYCFTPEVLAHSILSTTDITAACFTLLALYVFYQFMKSPSRKLLFAAGIALGLAQLSRYSAVLLYPIFLILALLEGFWSKKNFKISSSLVLIFALSVVTIWAGYGFRMKPFLAETINQQEKIEFVKNSAARFLPFWNKNLANKTEIFLKQTPMPLTTYITGFLGVMKHDKEGHLMFFWGKWSDYGNPLYYVLALLIKTPIALIIFFFAAFFSIPLKRLKKDEIYLILPISIIFIIASASKLQLGIRYILPIYPLIAIFSSRIILFVKNSWQRLIIVILTGWLIFTGVFAWPHYLSYFNEFIGGSDNGYKYLRDSNIDWGQDLPALGQYAKKNGTPTITLFYFGQDNPAMYGINFINFTKSEYIKPEKKIYAISVQYLDSVAWTKIYPPCAKAGYSIFIYDFRPPPGIK